MIRSVVLAVFVLCSASLAEAQIRITEWMYNGLGAGSTGEFVELTNMGASQVNFSGWSYDDNSRLAGTISLSGFGLVGPGESVILTDATAADFRANWSLPASVKVVGGNTANLGRNDEINIYDSALTLVDRLTYGDQDIPGTIRTQNVSGVPSSPAALGVNNASLWELSTNSVNGAVTSLLGEVGSPGHFAVIPEPASLTLLLGSLALVSGRRR